MRKITTETKREAAALKAIWRDHKANNKSLTQVRLAELCGYDNPVVVNQYINGYIPLNLTALLRFASALDFKPEQVSPRLAREIGDSALADQLPQQLKHTIDSDSMAPQLLQNDVVIIEPQAAIKNGDYIAVTDKEQGLTLIRKIQQEGKNHYLIATNPDWPNKITLLTDNHTILGKIIKRITYF